MGNYRAIVERRCLSAMTRNQRQYNWATLTFYVCSASGLCPVSNLDKRSYDLPNNASHREPSKSVLETKVDMKKRFREEQIIGFSDSHRQGLEFRSKALDHGAMRIVQLKLIEAERRSRMLISKVRRPLRDERPKDERPYLQMQAARQSGPVA